MYHKTPWEHSLIVIVCVGGRLKRRKELKTRRHLANEEMHADQLDLKQQGTILLAIYFFVDVRTYNTCQFIIEYI